MASRKGSSEAAAAASARHRLTRLRARRRNDCVAEKCGRCGWRGKRRRNVVVVPVPEELCARRHPCSCLAGKARPTRQFCEGDVHEAQRRSPEGGQETFPLSTGGVVGRHLAEDHPSAARVVHHLQHEADEADDADDAAPAPGPSLGPRDERGRYPCPAGCPRTFAHAPAAVQHGKSCQNGTRPPGSTPPQKRPAAPRAPRVPRAPQPPRERQFACERDKCVALICEAARDKLDPALRARPDDGSGRRTKAAWEALLAKYDPTPLASCVHTLGQLARYYSTHARRVDLLEGWRQGLTKWEKMMNSMAVWVLKMIVEEGDRADFLADVIGYILICWCDSAAPRRRRGR